MPRTSTRALVYGSATREVTAVGGGFMRYAALIVVLLVSLACRADESPLTRAESSSYSATSWYTDFIHFPTGTVEFEMTDEQGVLHRFRYHNATPLNDANFDLAVNFLEYWETCVVRGRLKGNQGIIWVIFSISTVSKNSRLWAIKITTFHVSECKRGIKDFPFK